VGPMLPQAESSRFARPRGVCRGSPWGRRGFTIVELTVVVSILSLILLITWPRINPQREGVRSAAAEIQMLLQRAQRTAVLNQHNVRVVFEIDERRALLHLDRNNDGEIQEGEPWQVFPLPDAIGFGLNGVPALHWGSDAISFPDQTVTFHRDGSASAEGGVYVSSRRQLLGGGRPDETRAVEVVRATGTVRCRGFAAGPGEWREGC
jgi:prepilin-type N-terminal cleavage/methylation domain-containing protein